MNTSVVSVRKATIADARRIAEIHVDAWQEAYPGVMPSDFLESITVERRESRWTKQLATGDWNVLVSEVDEDLAGWIVYGKSRDEDAGPAVGEVHALNVDPKFWGRGAGKALCREACHRLFEAGFDEVTLWVLEDNPRACLFYQALGFRLDPDARQDFRGPDFTAPEIRYRLSPADFAKE